MKHLNWTPWVRGLVGAVINSVASSLTVAVVDPADFNVGAGLGKLGMVAGAAAITGAGLYLKQHPLPDDVPMVGV